MFRDGFAKTAKLRIFHDALSKTTKLAKLTIFRERKVAPRIEKLVPLRFKNNNTQWRIHMEGPGGSGPPYQS